MRSRNLKRRSSFRTHILKVQISMVPKYPIRERKRSVRQLHGIVEDIGIGGKQVFVAVVVKIENADSPRGRSTGQGRESSNCRDILKLTVSNVLIEREAFSEHGSFEDIWPAIVVDVAEICTHSRDGITKRVVCHTCL